MKSFVRLLLAAVFLVVSAGPVVAADPVQVSGMVEDRSTSERIEGAVVRVYSDPDAAAGDLVDETLTDARGAFELSVPAHGDYWFTVSSPSNRHRPFTTYEQVTDESAQFMDFRLAPYEGSLTARVVDQFGESVSFWFEIFAADRTDEAPVAESDGGSYGSFRAQLPPGSYKIRITGHFIGDDERWMGGGSAADATVFEVADEERVDAGTLEVVRGGYISGTVRSASGAPLKGVRVTPYLSIGGGAYRAIGESYPTAADGTYRTDALVESMAKVRFEDPLGRVASGWNGGASSLAAAAPIDLVERSAGGVDVRLASAPAPARGRLIGRVVDVAGVGIANVTVTAYSAGQQRRITSTVSRVDGRYYFPDLVPGTYKLEFFDRDTVARYVPTYLWGTPSWSRAAAVVVPGSGSVTAPGTTLRAYGRLSGRVNVPARIAEHPDFFGVRVTGYDADGQVTIPTRLLEADNGFAFYLTQVAPGTHRLRFAALRVDGLAGEREIATEWYTNAYSLTTARGIVVKDGARVSGLSITLSDVLTAVTLPRVSGTPKVGRKLTASRGTWSRVGGISYRYQWYVSGVGPIKGATSSTYTVPESLVGRLLRVKVTAVDHAGTYVSGSSLSAVTQRVVK